MSAHPRAMPLQLRNAMGVPVKASALEFRLRYLLHGLVYGLAFWAPWDRWLHAGARGPNAHTWGVLSIQLFQSGSMSIGAAFNLLLGVGILFALAGAGTRTWAAAYLGSAVVKDGQMLAGMVTDGPYRFVRNPLYLGLWLHTCALALLMPVSGAVFALVAVALLDWRLILGEESFLREKLGTGYEAYQAKVPRVIPLLRPGVVSSGAPARWGQALLGELYFWGVAASFCFAGWLYDAKLLMQCVLVSFGLALVARALVPGTQSKQVS